MGHVFYYQHENCSERCLAYCVFPDDYKDRVFTLGLTKDLDSGYCMADIKRAAFHEVVEAFLYRIRNTAGSRYISLEEIDDEIHTIIRTLETVVFAGSKK